MLKPKHQTIQNQIITSKPGQNKTTQCRQYRIIEFELFPGLKFSILLLKDLTYSSFLFLSEVTESCRQWKSPGSYLNGSRTPLAIESPSRIFYKHNLCFQINPEFIYCQAQPSPNSSKFGWVSLIITLPAVCPQSTWNSIFWLS